MKTKVSSVILLFLTAIIWGFAFVAQKTVSETMSPFYFNAVRFLLGSISLIPVILIIDIINKNKRQSQLRLPFLFPLDNQRPRVYIVAYFIYVPLSILNIWLP